MGLLGDSELLAKNVMNDSGIGQGSGPLAMRGLASSLVGYLSVVAISPHEFLKDDLRSFSSWKEGGLSHLWASFYMTSAVYPDAYQDPFFLVFHHKDSRSTAGHSCCIQVLWNRTEFYEHG